MFWWLDKLQRETEKLSFNSTKLYSERTIFKKEFFCCCNIYNIIVNANILLVVIIADTCWNRAMRSRLGRPLPSTRTAWPSSGRWQRYSSTRGSSARTSVMSLLPVRNKIERCTYVERKYKKAFLPRFILSWHFVWFIPWYLTILCSLWLRASKIKDL